MICPSGTAKFASFGLTPYPSVHVFRSSASAAVEEAVVRPMTKVEIAFFHKSIGPQRIRMQVAAV